MGDFILANWEKVLTILVGIANVVIAGFLLWEYSKMRKANTEPDVIYKLGRDAGYVAAVLENIGGGIAREVKVEMVFDEPQRPTFAYENSEGENRSFKRNFDYLAPGQKLKLRLGQMVTGGGDPGFSPLGFGPHEAKVSYANKNGKKRQTVDFYVSDHHISGAGSEGSLAGIEVQLKRISGESRGPRSR